MNRERSRSPLRRDRDDRRRRDGSVEERKFSPNSDRMVYITNLSFKMEWQELKEIIREHADVQFVEVLKNRDGKSKGVAVVELATKEGVKKCIDALHRQQIGGRTLSAKEIRDPVAFFRKIRDDTGVDFLGGRGDRRRGSSRDRRPSPGLPIVGETYGLSANFLDSLNLKLPLVNRVFVTNIDYTCGVGKLFDVFSMAGRITWFDLQMDKEGKSRGMAIVEYSHPIEAVQAISMLHNQRLIDRTLTVKMDRFEKESDRDRHGIPMGLKHVGMGLGANGAPLKDIASVVGQIQQQPAINPFSTNTVAPLAPLMQPTQTAYSSNYQPLGQTTQQLSSAFEQPQYNQQPAVQNYVQPQVQTQPIHQPSPRPMNDNYYVNQNTASYQTEQSKPQQQTYVKQERISIGNSTLPPTNRQSLNVYSSTGHAEQTPSRVILIRNLPEDYTWNVVAQRLGQFGEYESVELVAAGTAKVRFLHVQEAKRARETLNGTLVESNVISVDYII